MASIGFILFADEVFNPNPAGNELMIKNPKIALTPEYVPGQFSFFLIFSLLDLEEKGYKMAFVFRHEETGEVAVAQDSLPFDFKKDNPEVLNPNINGTIINLHLNNIILKHEGKYSFTVTLDGISKTEYINVYKRVI